jgi:hypothetical protein
MPSASNVRRVPSFQNSALYESELRPAQSVVERWDLRPILLKAAMANGEMWNKDRPRMDAENAQSESGRNKRPFDTSGMNWVPEHEDDDPPYRDWWVVDEEQDDE